MNVSVSVDACNGPNWFFLYNPHQAWVSYPFSSIDASVNTDADADARCGQGITKSELPVISTRGPDELFFYYLILQFYKLTILSSNSLDTAAIHSLKYKQIHNHKGFLTVDEVRSSDPCGFFVPGCSLTLTEIFRLNGFRVDCKQGYWFFKRKPTKWHWSVWLVLSNSGNKTTNCVIKFCTPRTVQLMDLWL